MSKIKKIKSITVYVPIDTIGFNELKTSQIDKLTDNQLQALTSLAEECGKIEYDLLSNEKPKLLKHPDGSLVAEPKEGEKVWLLKFSYTDEEKDEELVLDMVSYNSIPHKTSLKEGKVFLKEDKPLAEKKAKMLTKQLEIQFEIDRLNAEEGWVADWSDLGQKKLSLYYNYNYNKISYSFQEFWQLSCQYMPKKTAEKILAKYSEEDLKMYLGITTG